MSNLGLTAMTKLEVIVQGEDLAAVTDVLDLAGARGYTLLSGVSGLGHGGFHQGSLYFNDRDGLHLVLVVVPEETAVPVIEAVRKLLETRPGVLFASTTYVSRPEYFR